MIQVLKQLVEALKISRDQNVDPEYAPIGWNVDRLDEAIQAGRQAIAELESQEPVACPYCHNSATLGAVYFDQNCVGCVKRMSPPTTAHMGRADG